MLGGVITGGSDFKIVWHEAVTSAIAASILDPGIAMKHWCPAQFYRNGVVLGFYFDSEPPPELSCRPKQSRKTAQVLRMESPLALLRSAATARARGPRCTPAAPMASGICKGCLERTL